MANPDFSQLFAANGTRDTINAAGYTGGWNTLTSNNSFPPKWQEFNAIQYYTDSKLVYLDKRSRDQWDADIMYKQGETAIDPNTLKMYSCTLGGRVNKLPSTHVDTVWALAGGESVTNVTNVYNDNTVTNVTTDTVETNNFQVPIGSILIHSSLNALPQGFIWCDGAALFKANFQVLSDLLGERYHADKFNTPTYLRPDKFRVPDLRGRFIRCISAGSNYQNFPSYPSYAAEVGRNNDPTFIRRNGLDYTSVLGTVRNPLVFIENSETGANYYTDGSWNQPRVRLGINTSVVSNLLENAGHGANPVGVAPVNMAMAFMIRAL